MDRKEIEAVAAQADPSLWNPDLAPVPPERRTWNAWHIASLWIGMSVCVPTYMLAAGLLQSGMNWWQAIGTILLGNLVVLVPMVLNAHAGTKYGIPLPVLLRASFGVRGANVPSVLRGLVACGWFGIQTWIGGSAIYQLALVLAPGWGLAPRIAFLGLNGYQLGCFLFFWALNMVFVWKGTESIKWLESLSAPILIAIGLALLGWGASKAGGLRAALARSEEFSRPTARIEWRDPTEPLTLHLGGVSDFGVARASKFRFVWAGSADEGEELLRELPWRPLESVVGLGHPWDISKGRSVTHLVVQLGDDAGHASSALRVAIPSAPSPGGRGTFWLLFLPSLTAMVGFWATLSLNIPDFTRYARSQRDQAVGQLLGLPTTMTLYSFVGVAVTCASLAAFPDILAAEDAPWDPVALLGRFKSPAIIVVSMFMLAVATLTTNLAANVVAPANAFTNLFPRKVSFRTGGLLTGLLGIVMMPWKLVETTQGYISTWLLGYGALLGPIGGIMVADYFLVRRLHLSLPDLYRERGAYRYARGVNPAAVAILFLAVLPSVPGFLASAGFVPASSVPSFFRELYTYAWFAGFAIAFALTALFGSRTEPEAVR